MNNDAQLHDKKGITPFQADILMSKRKFNGKYAAEVNAIPAIPKDSTSTSMAEKKKKMTKKKK